MSINNLLEMTSEIQTFIDKFELKYGYSLQVTLGVDESGIINKKNTLRSIELFSIMQMHLQCPHLSKIKAFSERNRTLEFMRYSQAFQYIAFCLGYKKTRIARLVNRNHATVINSIRQAENYLFSGCPEFKTIYLPLAKKIHHYVGNFSNDDTRQLKSKSMPVAVLTSEEDINSNHKSTLGIERAIE